MNVGTLGTQFLALRIFLLNLAKKLNARGQQHGTFRPNPAQPLTPVVHPEPLPRIPNRDYAPFTYDNHSVPVYMPAVCVFSHDPEHATKRLRTSVYHRFGQNIVVYDSKHFVFHTLFAGVRCGERKKEEKQNTRLGTII